ncbi:S8 family serine peptidase [Bacillus sp. 1P06AnD]|uniref:S8 family serine peptidase n=1 Tax=Bacillus sp. 1P06AnD TaxID=3132208 RepID=UPI00399F275D
MKKEGKNDFRWLTILMISLLVFPMMFSNTVSAEEAVGKSLITKSANEANSKISDSLLKQFDKKDKVTFLIKFKEQADPAATAEKAIKTAKDQKKSAAQTKYMKRSAIVSDLRTTAIKSQGNVTDFLKMQEKVGNASNIHSFYIVNAMAVTATKEVMDKIASLQEVEKILPNETRHLDATKIEASKAKTNGETQSIEWNIDHIGAPAVWDMGIDGSGTVVASIDSGVQWDHPALKEHYRGFDPTNPDNPSHEYNFFDAVNGRTEAYDDHGHGTHVTGTMVGSEPNGENQIGVAPGAKWIAVKALNADGSGTDAQLIAAGEWILAPKDASGNPNPEMAPDVVNNSWGGGPGIDEWYRQIVQAWRAADIFPEFSAGNTTPFNPGGPGSIANPANYPESFATGATDNKNNLAGFSLQGPSPYGVMKPDISAPGVNIRSSVPGSKYQGGWNGTSMAGPHVAAVAALLRQVNANISVEDMEDILITASTPLTNDQYSESPNNGFGSGLVNAHDAVTAMISGLGTLKGQVVFAGEDNEAPSVNHSAPEEVYAGMDVPLEISVTDNISVTNVALNYVAEDGSNKSVNAERTVGNAKDGVYKAVIPGSDVTEPSISYNWMANDAGGNAANTNNYEVPVKPGITVGYFTDFESTPIGWTSLTDEAWEWGVPTAGPGSAFSGEKVFSTKLKGSYNLLENQTLIMPPIQLPKGNSYLQFKQWYHMTNDVDFGHIVVSTDKQNWTQLATLTNRSDGWVDGQINLSKYASERIYVGFNFTSSDTFNLFRPGWFIDDVGLSNKPLGESQARNSVFDDKWKGTIEVNDHKTVKISAILPKVDEKSVSKVNEQKSDLAAIPISAKVSVLESGKSVNTNPEDGSYRLRHAIGKYTVLAESYGNRSATQTVDIGADGETTANFTLEELPKGTITGTVTNELTGKPVKGVTLLLVEDAQVKPVVTDQNGHYSLKAYQDHYTLRIMESSYIGKEISITLDGSSLEQNIEMKPLTGFQGEIGYDDGSAEDFAALANAGDMFAVKMSLEEGQESAMVTGGLFRFGDTSFPVPGGTDIQVAIYDVNKDGSPGQKMAGPFDATALRNGQWTHVDLSHKGIKVNHDFFMVYIQPKSLPNIPAIGMDWKGSDGSRSWYFAQGEWRREKGSEELGVFVNFMIRAIVNYELSAPVITKPASGSYTKEGVITVEGTSKANADIEIYNNGAPVISTKSSAEGTFAANITLTEGDNVLTATERSVGGESEPSKPVKVVLDQTEPELMITSPIDKSKTNKETVTVEGTVSDANLETVEVNGQKANVKDGKYSCRILLDEGKNNIKVTATDKAGHKVSKSITITAKFTAPTIENLLPRDNKELHAGQTVTIEFDSEQGLTASFAIKMPLTNSGNHMTNAIDLPFKETVPGHYVGYYTATSNVVANGAEIEVKAEDGFGNVTRVSAEGKLWINSGGTKGKRDY